MFSVQMKSYLVLEQFISYLNDTTDLAGTEDHRVLNIT